MNNCQEDSTPRPQRLPLPAPVALAILGLAERLLSSVHWDKRNPQLLLLRAATTSIASYLFFNRGECSACALMADIAIDDTHITLQLRHEKGNKALNEGAQERKANAGSGGPKNCTNDRSILYMCMLYG